MAKPIVMRFFCFSVALVVVVLSTSAQLPSYVPTDNLISFYPLDGHALDAGLNGLDGILAGATPTANRFGDPGGALSFDGQDDFIRIHHSNEFDALAMEFTISAWIKNVTWTQPNWLYYVSKSDQLGGWGFNGGFLLRAGADGGGGFGYVPKMETTGGEWQFSSPNPLVPEWEHVAFQFTGDSAHLYRNGNRVASRASLGGDMVLNTFDIIIGAGYEAQDHHALADLDEIGIWSRALTEEEIGQLAGVVVPCNQAISLDEVTVLTTPTNLESTNGEVAVTLATGEAISITMEGLNGSPDYQFAMPGDLNGIGPGYYQVTAVDANGCISDPLSLVVGYDLCCECGVSDLDSDGICDDEDNCTNRMAQNFADPANGLCQGCVSPVLDDYTYAVVEIGGACWFAENLRTTKYLDGSEIISGLTPEEWQLTTAGARTLYGEGDTQCNDYSPTVNSCDTSDALATYGRLYNWYVVGDPRGVCPIGWHVASGTDWSNLVEYVSSQGHQGMEGVALRSSEGWSYCCSPNAFGNGTDDFGFNGLASGYRWTNGQFWNSGYTSYWWGSTSTGQIRCMYNSIGTLGGGGLPPNYGNPIRCVKD